MPEHGAGAGAGPVSAVDAFIEYACQKIEILLHDGTLWTGLSKYPKGRMANSGNQVAMAGFSGFGKHAFKAWPPVLYWKCRFAGYGDKRAVK